MNSVEPSGSARIKLGQVCRVVAAGDLESREVIRRAAAVAGQHARETAAHDAQGLAGGALGPSDTGPAQA